MENAEEVMQILERFTRLKQKEIPKELDEYLQFVAKTGDTVFKWANLKYLFREKLLNVITHFYDTTPRMDEIPQYPNVDPFNYESMKSSLLERLELFNAAPFTIQRLCELLIDPKKQYNRIDKFMRALEKNILVSTVEPGRKRTESENGDSLDSVVNGDISLDVNVDIDMESEALFNIEATPNGNGIAAAVSPVATTVETTNKTEHVSDKKPDDESEAIASVTSKHEAPTGDDEDLQPSPKKAKLDTDAPPAVTTVAVGVAATTAVVAPVVTEEPIKPVEKIEATKAEKTEEVVVAKETVEEKKIEEIKTVSVETKADANGVKEGELEKVDNKKEEPETESKVECSEEKSEAKTTCENKKNEKKEEEDVSKIDSCTTTVAATVETSKATAATAVIDKELNKDKNEVDSSNGKDDGKLDEISSAVDQQNEVKAVEEKIVEKQEIEKCEKELISEKVESKTSSMTDDNTPTQSENDKIIEKKTDIETNGKDSIPKEDDKESKEKSNNEAEVAVEKSIVPKDAAAIVVETKAEASTNVVECDANKSITSSTTAATIVEEATKTDDDDGVETSVSTTEDIKKSVITKPPETVESATTIITSTSTRESTSKIKDIETPGETKTTTTAASTTTPIDDEKQHITPAVKTDEKVKPAAETIIATDAAAATATTATAISVAAVGAGITPTPPPTLILNDQPMEEDAITNAVDEVVMTESITTTTVDGTEMATDAMEATVSSDATKIDEPADGMEVDDTSPQEEAMDQ